MPFHIEPNSLPTRGIIWTLSKPHICCQVLPLCKTLRCFFLKSLVNACFNQASYSEKNAQFPAVKPNLITLPRLLKLSISEDRYWWTLTVHGMHSPSMKGKWNICAYKRRPACSELHSACFAITNIISTSLCAATKQQSCKFTHQFAQQGTALHNHCKKSQHL